MTIFNKDQVNFSKQPMFFGDEPNIARYDIQTYPIFEKLTEKQIGFFWQPKEVDLSKDGRDWKTMSFHEHHIFAENLKYQILLDSIQGRSPTLALLPHVSVPELEVCIQNWAFMECIHSRSYTYIIQNLFSNPSEIFDSILENDKIIDRAKSVTVFYDDFIEYATWHKMLGLGKHSINGKTVEITSKGLKKRLYKVLCSINILEGIRFYVSFACSWSFAERDLMEGNAKIIELIARDEAVHLGITTNMIKILKKSDDDEMQEVINELEPEIYQMFDDCVTQEQEWAEHLFQHGSVIGLNAQILGDFVKYRANRCLIGIGLKRMYDQPTNPLPWIGSYTGETLKQVAPQETEISSYIIGCITANVDENGLDLSI